MRRIALHYFSSLGIITIYGIQVCPFIESLTLAQLVVILGAAFSLQALLHWRLWPMMITEQEYSYQSRAVFRWVLTLYLLGGVAVMLYNHLFHDFPLGSGLKVLTGFVALGIFCAVDLSLKHERRLNERFALSGESINPEEAYFSQPKRLALFAGSISLLMVAVFFLLISKDLDWMMDQGAGLDLMTARKAILIEVLFVVAVAFTHLMNLILSYAKNLQLFFNQETGALHAASKGDFSRIVPISTKDEFGLIAKHTNDMIISLKIRTEEVQQTQDVTILSLASLAETRDNETGAHLLRTQNYVKALARHLQSHPDCREELIDENIELIYKSAPLHDIGKVGIPDAILLKPGKLTDEEFTIMKNHAQLGAEALTEALGELGENNFLQYAHQIAQSHHERWDGKGYPNGLKAETIPLCARLMSVADVYDALISKRVYKDAFPHAKAAKIIRENHGSSFDPKVVDAFNAVEEEFKAIAREFGDEHTLAVFEDEG